MKYSVFFVLVSLFFLSPPLILAQTTASTAAFIQTTSCGIASDPNMNKCCYTRAPSTQAPNTGNILFDAVASLVNGLKDAVLNPVVDTILTQIRPIDTPCFEGVPSTPGQLGSNSCICLPNPGKSNLEALNKLCDHAGGSGATSCRSCLAGGGVWTGIGCVQADIQSFIQETLLGMGIGIAGGISMLCLIFAAFQMQTSGGNAEKLKKAQELLTNCITGLMVIIFSTLILKIIGVDILKIPSFR